MKNLSIKKILIGAFSLVLIFQLCLIIGVIPYEYTWGGRLKSENEMYVFVSISILLNLIFLLTILKTANQISWNIPKTAIKTILWFMVVIFALNTVGNLFAKTYLEKFIATPITLLLSIMCYKIATE
ncbi:MAG: hypothetical protein ACK4NY_01680 [Spirosomataceae bacterium]